MTLKPRFWGCYFFKTHTGTAFYSEQLDFHLRVWTEPKICCENSSVIEDSSVLVTTKEVIL